MHMCMLILQLAESQLCTDPTRRHLEGAQSTVIMMHVTAPMHTATTK